MPLRYALIANFAPQRANVIKMGVKLLGCVELRKTNGRMSTLSAVRTNVEFNPWL